ncbi:MAG: glycosyltransferase family 2 protein [Acidimicrobiales bacterium]
MIVALEDDPDVVAVVPTLAGNLSRLRRCIASVFESEINERLAVIVVWNDPRVECVDLGPVTILEPGLNLGLPGGMNFARESITAPRLWIIQDDMTVPPNCLRSLMERQEHPDHPAVVSPIIVNEQGIIPAKSRAGTVKPDGALDQWYPFEDVAPEALDPEVHLDWVSLSGALVRSDAWDAVGGMDPAFFPLMHSDVDFGYRVTREGMTVVLEPSAVISHERNGSTPSLFARFLYERNAQRFEAKHRPNGSSETAGKSESIAEITSREASVMVVDFAQYAERYIDGTRDMISALEASVAEHYQHFLNIQSQAVALEAQVHERDRQIEQCQMDSQEAISRLMASRSMRITRPLRVLGSWARKIRRD